MALEHLVRLGNAGGSSLQDRYNKLMSAGDEAGAQAFLDHYGVRAPLHPWSRLPNMTFDWTTKYEPADRHLSLQETLHISGVPADILNQAVQTLTFATVYANKYFADIGLQLWDMKWEVAVENGQVILADTLDHDSIRVTLPLEYEAGRSCHIHFNKQAMRDYLRILHPSWHDALIRAKGRAIQAGESRTFREIYDEGVKAYRYPAIPQIDPAFIELQRRKYEFVTNAHGASQSALAEAQEIGKAELAYYQSRGQLDAFLRRNAS